MVPCNVSAVTSNLRNRVNKELTVTRLPLMLIWTRMQSFFKLKRSSKTFYEMMHITKKYLVGEYIILWLKLYLIKLYFFIFFQSAIVLPTQVDPQMYIGLHDQPVRNELDNGHRHGRSVQRR